MLYCVVLPCVDLFKQTLFGSCDQFLPKVWTLGFNFVLTFFLTTFVTHPVTLFRGGGYSGFQVTGMVEGFFEGLKFSILSFFGGRKIC